ncbi:MAG: hypothetical protein MUO67_07690 [Anaerolineales bacterium]|nr:hypothetical protein [Anaerolineales bacterium]
MASQTSGISLYLEKTKQFSSNAKLVLLHSALAGFSFGVFRFLFNFYVLSLGNGYDEAFIGTLQTVASFATIIPGRLPPSSKAETGVSFVFEIGFI